MKPRKQDFLLGLAVIIFLVLLLLTVVFLARPTLGPTRPITVVFPQHETIAPVAKGSDVLLSGALKVGVVTGTGFSKPEVESPRGSHPTLVVEVYAQIEKALPLYGDCKITTEMPLIGGTGNLIILDVGTPGVPLPPGPIHGLPAEGVAALGTITRRLTQPGGIIDRIDRMLDPDLEGSLLNRVMLTLSDVNAITGELRLQLSVEERGTLLGKLQLTLDDLHAASSAIREQLQVSTPGTLMAKLNTALDIIHTDLQVILDLIQDSRPLVHDTLTDLQHTARVIDRDVAVQLSAQFNPGNPESLLAMARTAMAGVNSIVADFQVVSQSAKDMLVIDAEKVKIILDHLEEMSVQLAATSRELRLNPARLIWGPSRGEQKRVAAFEAARDFAQAAQALDQAATDLRNILQATRPGELGPEDRRRIQEMYQSLQSAFDRFDQAQRYFWQQMK
jgi:hypothetical protein